MRSLRSARRCEFRGRCGLGSKAPSTRQGSALKRGLGGNRNVHRRSEEPAPQEEQCSQYTSGQKGILRTAGSKRLFRPFLADQKGARAGARNRPTKSADFAGTPQNFTSSGGVNPPLRQGLAGARRLYGAARRGGAEAAGEAVFTRPRPPLSPSQRYAARPAASVLPTGCAIPRGPRGFNLRGRSESALAPRFSPSAKMLVRRRAAKALLPGGSRRYLTASAPPR